MPTETPTAPATAPSKVPDAPTLDTPAASEKAPTDFMADIVGDFADMDAGKAPAPRDDKGKFKSDKPASKPTEKPTSKAPEKPAETEPEPEPEPEKSAEKPAEVKPVKAAELRNAYEGLKKRVKDELEPEVQRLRSKVQEFESKKPEDAGPLNERIKALQEQNAALGETHRIR